MPGFFGPVIRDFSHNMPVISKCGECGLYRTCTSPRMPVTGQGRRGILVVAEAPGAEEDARNEQLIGAAGQTLRAALRSEGIDLDVDCWKTNAIICRPPKNRTPTANEIDACRPNLDRTIRELNPTSIILLGGSSVRSVFGAIWRSDTGPVSRWVGYHVPIQSYNAWGSVTYHPSFVNRSENMPNGPVVRIWFERHLKEAVRLSYHRPFEDGNIPDYGELVEIIQDPSVVARRIRKYIRRGGAISFDYETNCLHPDNSGAQIVCCSICWRGRETISFPWVGTELLSAMSDLLRSKIPKIGANCKFEDLWTRSVFGHPVRNWAWDCMLSAHHLDNRRGITSVKFQAFVRLGMPNWDAPVKPYLSKISSSGINHISEIDPWVLLKYCGIDSLVEYKIAELQRSETRSRNNDTGV